MKQYPVCYSPLRIQTKFDSPSTLVPVLGYTLKSRVGRSKLTKCHFHSFWQKIRLEKVQCTSSVNPNHVISGLPNCPNTAYSATNPRFILQNLNSPSYVNLYFISALIYILNWVFEASYKPDPTVGISRSRVSLS